MRPATLAREGDVEPDVQRQAGPKTATGLRVLQRVWSLRPATIARDRHADGDTAGIGNEDPPSIVALAEMPRVQNHEHVPAADREIRGAEYELVPAAE